MRASGATSAIAPRGRLRPQVRRRRLARCAGPARRRANSARYSSSVCGGALRPRRRALVQLGREEPRLLVVGHEDLRVAPQHLVQRRRAALGVPDDEEVGSTPVADAGMRELLLVRSISSVPASREDRSPQYTGHPSRRPARRRAVVGVVSEQELDRVEGDQPAVDDHHHAVADVERGHAVGDDEQRQLAASAVSDSWMSASECGSSALVGSSSTSTSGLRGERPGEADPLLLAAGDGVGPGADDRLVAGDQPTMSSWMRASRAARSTASSSRSRK